MRQNVIWCGALGDLIDCIPKRTGSHESVDLEATLATSFMKNIPKNVASIDYLYCFFNFSHGCFDPILCNIVYELPRIKKAELSACLYAYITILSEKSLEVLHQQIVAYEVDEGRESRQ